MFAIGLKNTSNFLASSMFLTSKSAEQSEIKIMDRSKIVFISFLDYSRGDLSRE